MLKEIGVIDINQFFIRAVIVAFNSANNSFVIKKVAIEKTPINSVRNSIIVDYSAVRNAILKLIRVNGINVKTFYLTVSGKYTYSKSLEIPPLEDKDVYKALDLQIRKLIPIQKDVIYDFLRISNLSSTNQRLLLIAIEKEIINSRLNLLNSLNLSIKGVNVSSISSAYFVQNEFYENKAFSVVYFSDISTDIVIIKDGKISFIRTIQVGLCDIINSISQKRKITAEDSFNVWLNSYANFEETDDTGFKEEILSVIDNLSSEIEDSILFYENSPLSEEIELVVLCGEISRLINFDYYLQNKLGKKTVYSKLGNFVSLNKNEIEEAYFSPVSMEFSHLIGQAIFSLSNEKINSVNLLPRDFIKKEKESKFIFFNILFLIAFLFCLIAHFFYVYNKLKIANLKLHKLDIKTKSMDVSYVEKLEDDNKELTYKIKILRSLFFDEVPIRHILKDLSMIVPKNVFLKKMEIEKDGNLIIEGKGLSQEEIGFFVENLKSSKFFKNVSLISTHRFMSEDGKEYINFKIGIVCKIRGELTENL